MFKEPDAITLCILYRYESCLLPAFGVRSQQLAAQATAEGRFEREILPVLGADGALMTTDEGLRETTMESLAKLKPSFRPEEEGGRVTAGGEFNEFDGRGHPVSIALVCGIEMRPILVSAACNLERRL